MGRPLHLGAQPGEARVNAVRRRLRSVLLASKTPRGDSNSSKNTWTPTARRARPSGPTNSRWNGRVFPRPRHRRGVEKSTTDRCRTGLRHRRHLRHPRLAPAGRPLLAVVLERGDDLVCRPGRRRAAGLAPGAARLAGLAPEPAPGSTGQPGLARGFSGRRHGLRAVAAKRQHDGASTPAPLEAELEAPVQTPSQN